MKNVEDVYPLSPTQQGLLFHSLYAPESAVYFAQVVCGLQGDLEIEAFKRAWESVMRRHPILRSAYVWEGLDEPLQVVRKEARLPWNYQDWRALPPDEQQCQLEHFLEEDKACGFDLKKAPLMRFMLIRSEDRVHELVWSHHHLLLDGWSLFLIFKDVFDAYHAYTSGQENRPEAVRPYRDYILWLRKQDIAAAESFWRKMLEGFSMPTALAGDQKPDKVEDQGQGKRYANLTEASTASLRSSAKLHRLTLNTLVLGAWALLLSRYSGEKDVVFGTVVSGRPGELTGVESMVGPFINTLPIRARLSADATLSSWLKDLQELQIEVRRFEYTPLTQLQGWSDIPRGLPLFESILVFDNYPIDNSFREETAALQITHIGSIERTNYPVTLTVRPDRELALQISYDTPRFSAYRIERMFEHLQTLLEEMSKKLDRPLSEVQMLTERERYQLLIEWNNTQVDYKSSQCLHHLFEAQTQKTPDRTALVYDWRRLTYAELNRRANRLANYLQKLGVGPETLVGICVGRNLEMVVGLLAILKAGAAYVPLDPAYPKQRLSFILEDAKASVLITQADLAAELSNQAARLVCLDLIECELVKESSAPPSTTTTRDNLGYVIYTSGSTGRPKGVAIEHRSAVTFLHWARDFFGAESFDGMLASTSICFDLSVFEIFAPLSWGGKVILAENALELPAQPAAREVILINTVPSAMAELIRLDSIGPSVKTVNLAGEPLQNHLAQGIYEQSRVEQVYNLYGPSEDTTYSTFAQIVRGASSDVPIGCPISNTQIYLVSRDLQPVPVGAIGEIYTGGEGLARGYWDRPATTAERFIPNPFSDAGTRLYKTGDLGRYRADGTIDFLGRIDHQIKIRGFRIELGEIEAVLRQHPLVSQTVVVACENQFGQKQLIAYIVTTKKEPLSPGALRAHLQQKLPNYMVPAFFIPLDALPLTPNGKLNRQALPAPDGNAVELNASYIAPRNNTEQLLADIWSSILRVDQFGIHDNFFELGGDSILNIQIVARAAKSGIRFTPRQLFQNPTIAQLVKVVAVVEEIKIEQEIVIGELPLTPIQHWFFERELVNPQHFNQAVLLQLDPLVQPALLQQALNALLLHHDALRLCFSAASSTAWLQQVAPPQPFSLIHHDLSDLPAQRLPEAIDRYASLAHAAFDLASGPLLKALFFRLPPPLPPRLLLIIHHLAVDGLSWRILLEDLSTAYGQLVSQEAVNLGAKTSSYKEWASRLVERAQEAGLVEQVAYWQGVVGCQVAALPVDKRGGENLVRTTAVVSRGLTEEETRGLLQEVPQAYHTQINEVLLTALLLAYEEWGGGECLVVELEGHGRQEMKEGLDVTRTVGWFTTMHPVRLEKREGEEEVEVMKRVKEELRRVPEQGIGYGMLKYLSKDEEVRKRMREMVQAEMSFNYLGQFEGRAGERLGWRVLEEGGGQGQSEESERSHKIGVVGWVRERQLQMSWSYSEEMYEARSMERFADAYLHHLRSIIALCKTALQSDNRRIEPAREKEECRYPLSSMQKIMLYQSIYARNLDVYIIQFSTDIQGDLDAQAFERAWQCIINRHPVLRTSFVWENMENPLQVVHDDVEFAIAHHDWRGLTSPEQQEQIENLFEADRAKGFNLSHAPLMRVTVVRMTNDTHYLIWTFHHLLLDGWSVPILLKEIFAHYEAFSLNHSLFLPESKPFRDYIIWITTQDLSRSEAFWRKSLQGFKSPTSFYTDAMPHERARKNGAYGVRQLYLPSALTESLRRFARQFQLTLNTIVQGAWGLVLCRFSGEQDVVFGSVVSGRTAGPDDIGSMVGPLINVLPVRVKLTPGLNTVDLLRHLQAEQAEMRQYEYTPLDELQRWTDVPKGLPLFESILRFQNFPLDASLQGEGEALAGHRVRFYDTWHYPISVVAVPRTELQLKITYSRKQFNDEIIGSILGHFGEVLEAFVANPHQSVSGLRSLVASRR